MAEISARKAEKMVSTISVKLQFFPLSFSFSVSLFCLFVCLLFCFLRGEVGEEEEKNRD